jgi:hypothetical protein
VANLKNSTRPYLSDLAKDFLKEEQKQRRQEIERYIGQIESDQRYGLIITGVIWSWLVTNREKLQAPFDLVVIFIPTFIMLFFLWRWKATKMAVYQVGKYTKELEKLFAVPEQFGWETWLAGIICKSGKKNSLERYSFWYWILHAFGNFILAGLFMWFARGGGKSLKMFI